MTLGRLTASTTATDSQAPGRATRDIVQRCETISGVGLRREIAVAIHSYALKIWRLGSLHEKIFYPYISICCEALKIFCTLFLYTPRSLKATSTSKR